MFTSDSDNEVLTAARKANNVLKKHKATWEELIRGSIKVTATPEPIPKSKKETAKSEDHVKAYWGGKYGTKDPAAKPHQKRAAWMIDRGNWILLSDKEKEFVYFMQDNFDPTLLEVNRLKTLYWKCGGR